MCCRARGSSAAASSVSILIVIGASCSPARYYSAQRGVGRSPAHPAASAPRLVVDQLPRVVVAVLGGEEHSPRRTVYPPAWDLGTEQACDRGVSVGDVDAGDLVVTLVLIAVHPREAGVDGRRRIPAD